MAMDDPNLGKTGGMSGDRLGTRSGNCQCILYVHFVLGTALNVSYRDLVILTITQ